MRLLVVEDNEKLAQLVANGLAAEGYASDFAGTAGEARTVLAGTRYAAVILDLNLPDADGLSVLRDILAGEDPMLGPCGSRETRKRCSAPSATSSRVRSITPRRKQRLKSSWKGAAPCPSSTAAPACGKANEPSSSNIFGAGNAAGREARASGCRSSSASWRPTPAPSASRTVPTAARGSRCILRRLIRPGRFLIPAGDRGQRPTPQRISKEFADGGAI